MSEDLFDNMPGAPELQARESGSTVHSASTTGTTIVERVFRAGANVPALLGAVGTQGARLFERLTNPNSAQVSVDFESDIFQNWVGAPKHQHKALIENYEEQHKANHGSLVEIHNDMNGLGRDLVADNMKLQGLEFQVENLKRKIKGKNRRYKQLLDMGVETQEADDKLTMEFLISCQFKAEAIPKIYNVRFFLPWLRSSRFFLLS